MTNAIVLYDDDFARSNGYVYDNGAPVLLMEAIRRMHAERLQMIEETGVDPLVVVQAQSVIDTADRALRALTPIITEAAHALSSMARKLQVWGLLPPDPTGQRHGTRWTSPVDGTRYRVAGRRGRVATYHWIEAGPRRARLAV
ncbi:MAG TPA: hypothetical protein VHB02_06090 [Acidimicrobiales bacterium]|nr:hypothetical protein [Acidimicrobiales bacterium]